MKIDATAALVTGGGSGLGAATARELARRGARVSLLDVNQAAAQAVAAEIGALALHCDVADEGSTAGAIAAAAERHGPARILVNAAGIVAARRLVGKDGSPMPLADFRRVVEVNLVGTFNAIRLAAAEMLKLDPLEHGERGVVACTASIAAFDGQIGQAAYAASKGGVASLTLPLARDLAAFGVRVATVAPGLFETPMLGQLPSEARQALAASIPFPRRLGQPPEYASLVVEIIGNVFLNGEVIRLDGALRMAPR